MPKLAKGVALRLAEKAKEEKVKEVSLQNKERDNKNVRNKSTNIPNNQQVGVKSTPATNQNPALVNRSGNGLRKPEVKLPKVPTIGNSSVSNTSMKAIW